ncbi:hypothetical protein KO516_00645 [Citreicella sp. C3M06]|uniref:hypothetical protein n=1 Tax=Citreicella sp. C3M06 TaxID=2841564 RepID=UPI001C095517|nr:hypothetical protein [Citreicella sp. C3M06]MBU2959349.1 hypothetical protein [Citreicella sp. C3M06]
MHWLGRHFNNMVRQRKAQPFSEKKLSLTQFLSAVQKHPVCIVAMQARSIAHRCAQFAARGHALHLIAPEFVKPYVTHRKNDMANAEAIAETGNGRKVINALRRHLTDKGREAVDMLWAVLEPGHERVQDLLPAHRHMAER